MKKLLFIAAIASAALAACTKNDVVPSASEQQEITFANPVSHVVTKVDLITGDYLTTSSFSVFADYHKAAYNSTGVTYTPYMRDTEGVDVTYNDESITIGSNTFDQYWAPSKTYYWPKDGYLTFAAYSPAGTKNNAEIEYDITNGVKIDNYVVTLSNQCDLMLSNRVVDQQSTSMEVNKPYDGVQLTFYHVLSAIDFTVKTRKDYKADSYTITLKSITIQNAFTTGTLTQFAGASTVNIVPNDIWSGQSVPDSYLVPSTEDVEIISEEKAITNAANVADLVLLPQNLVHGTGEDAPKVLAEVVYTVSHPDMGGTPIEYSASLNLSGATDGKWEAGKRYTYQITIGMDEVVFAPQVDEWENGGNVGI